MVGKAGVWGHFGSWDFDRAAMAFKTKKLGRSEALNVLTSEFGLSDEEAEKIEKEHLKLKTRTEL
ncbi:MAG: hypothetical protein IH949_00875 [Bacteroidetes bacterium]|nr:hypothetical protein [Bacteroidota bacterium]